jgi:molecular chaperone GrpE
MSEDVPSDESLPLSPDAAADEGGLLIEVDAPPPQDRVAQLEAALAEAQKEKKETWDKFVRVSADLENYRRRAKRDMDDAKADARTRVLKEMLPVIDNLERALAHTDGTAGDIGSILEGVKLVLRQFSHALEKCEVTAVEAEGKPFDPNLHEAIGQQESDAAPGTVVSVLQKGYRLSDRLLRPALVMVARGKPDAPSDAGTDGSA